MSSEAGAVRSPSIMRKWIPVLQRSRNCRAASCGSSTASIPCSFAWPGLIKHLAELRKFRRRADHDPKEVEIVSAEQHIEEGSAEPPQHADDILIVLIQREKRFGLFAAVFDERLEQLFLAGEMRVKRAFRYARNADDIADAGAVEAVLQKNPARAL